MTGPETPEGAAILNEILDALAELRTDLARSLEGQSVLKGAQVLRIEPVLLSKREAARALGLSVRHFERHVQPSLGSVLSGQLRLFRLADLNAWADEQLTHGGRAAARSSR